MPLTLSSALRAGTPQRQGCSVLKQGLGTHPLASKALLKYWNNGPDNDSLFFNDARGGWQGRGSWGNHGSDQLGGQAQRQRSKAGRRQRQGVLCDICGWYVPHKLFCGLQQKGATNTSHIGGCGPAPFCCNSPQALDTCRLAWQPALPTHAVRCTRATCSAQCTAGNRHTAPPARNALASARLCNALKPICPKPPVGLFQPQAVPSRTRMAPHHGPDRIF